MLLLFLVVVDIEVASDVIVGGFEKEPTQNFTTRDTITSMTFVQATHENAPRERASQNAKCTIWCNRIDCVKATVVKREKSTLTFLQS